MDSALFRLSALPNLGPVSAQWLIDANIHDLATIIRLGPVRTYLEVKHLHPKASLNLLYALAGAVHECKWNQLPADLKSSLLIELDALESLN